MGVTLPYRQHANRNWDRNLYISASPTFWVFFLSNQRDLAHEEYRQPFLLARGCDDSILASAKLLYNLEVRRAQIFPFARISLSSSSLLNVQTTSNETIVTKTSFQGCKTHSDCMSIAKEVNDCLVFK